MDDTKSRMFLHVGDSAAVDRDWTVVILGFHVEGTTEFVDVTVGVAGSSVEDIVIVAIEGPSVDGIAAVEGLSVDDIAAVDALLGGDVVAEAIVEVGVVDCFDVGGDT